MSFRTSLTLLSVVLGLAFAQIENTVAQINGNVSSEAGTENSTIPGSNISYVNNVTIAGWQGTAEIVNASAPFNSSFPAGISQNLSGRYPVSNFSLFLADLHYTSGNLSDQYIAYHYCYFIQQNFMECLLFNGSDSANSRLKGTEWFITADVFAELPFEERKLWHSHPFEIMTGLFVAPDLSSQDEEAVMQWLMGTYGKVTDVWSGQFGFPLGPPRVGMALALESQVNFTLADVMDQQLNLSTTWQQRQQARANWTIPPKVPGADWYLTSGYASQYEVYYFPMNNVSSI